MLIGVNTVNVNRGGPLTAVTQRQEVSTTSLERVGLCCKLRVYAGEYSCYREVVLTACH